MNYVLGRILQKIEEGYLCGQRTKICFRKDFEKGAHRSSQIVEAIAKPLLICLRSQKTALPLSYTKFETCGMIVLSGAYET